MMRGRTRPEAKPHAGTDKLERSGCGRALLQLDACRCRNGLLTHVRIKSWRGSVPCRGEAFAPGSPPRRIVERCISALVPASIVPLSTTPFDLQALRPPSLATSKPCDLQALRPPSLVTSKPCQ